MLEKLLHPLAVRWRWVAIALKVQQRFSDVRGGSLAAAVTLNVFLSIFPLLLVAIAVVGFITNRGTDIAGQVINNLGLTGTAETQVKVALDQAANTRKATSAVGLVSLLWSGLGVVSAIEYALDATWQLTGRGITDKVRGVVWALGALVILGASAGLIALLKIVSPGLFIGGLTIIAGVIVNFAFWMWTFRVLHLRHIGQRAQVPGAILAAVGLEIIKQVASIAPTLFSGASVLYGSIGVVFTVLAVLALFGRLVVYASVLNVVLWEEDHGTVTIDVEVPRVPGEVPLEADRAGAVESPVAGAE